MLKRILNLAISSVFGVLDGIRSLGGRLVGIKPASKCVVLAYHSVTAGERKDFARQMDVLLKTAKAVPADLASLPADGAAYAAVTFDDGFQNVVDNALPELQKRAIPSTLFIVTEALGTNRAWEHRGGDDTRNEQIMTAEQLRVLSPELVTVGSHTMTHPYLPSLEKDKLQQELAGSRKKLTEIVNREVRTLSFPYGAFNQSIVDGCREAGFARVFTALPVFAMTEPDEFVSGRVGTAPTDWAIEFKLKLVGAYRWLPKAYALKRSLKGWLSTARGKSPQINATQKGVA